MTDREKLEEIAKQLSEASRDKAFKEPFRETCLHVLTIFVLDGYLPEPPGWNLKKDGDPAFRYGTRTPFE